MGELIVKRGDIAKIAEKNGLGNVIKPLTKEIHLFDTHIAGTTHLLDKSVLNEIAIGSKLNLVREDNKHDEKAIMVFLDNKKAGYIPQKDNLIFSRLMDAGKLLIAKVTKIEERGETFKYITIGIYLVDF